MDRHRPTEAQPQIVGDRNGDDHGPAVEGDVAVGFEAVRDRFVEEARLVGDGGAAFAAVLDGQVVVDLWAGRAGAEPWRRETRSVLFSTTKGIVATAVALLIERGELDLDAPVASYWPEFAAGGKAEVTVAQMLSHSAGLVTIPGYEDLLTLGPEGWDRTDEIVRRLASAEPAWPPGTATGYHGVTIGWLVGELVRRITGASVGTLLRREIAEPLGLELDLGTPPERQRLVAPLVLPGGVSALGPPEPGADPELYARMFLSIGGRNVLDDAPAFFGNPAILALELAGANATGTARAIATLYGALANGGRHDGVQLLSPETIALVSAERISGRDFVTGSQVRRGLGFARIAPDEQQSMAACWWGPNESFGTNGYGGQMGFADPVDRVGVGFVRSSLSETSPLGANLVRSLYACL